MSDIDIAARYVKKAEWAKEKGIEFSLSFFEYKKLSNRKRCAYSDIEFSEYVDGKPVDSFRMKTLERINNDLGYTYDNVIAVCYGINVLKGTWENPNNQLSFELVSKVVKNIHKIKRQYEN